MAIVIPMINLKGGVAKTTTTVGLAEMLVAEYQKKVLIIDLDPQSNATLMLMSEDKLNDLNDQGYTLATLFEETLEPDETKFILEKTIQKNVSNIKSVKDLDLIPSSLELLDVQDILAKMSTGPFHDINPIEILKRALQPIRFSYDYILIDCPPNLGIITLNGLRMANGYIIPTVPDILSTYGIPQMVNRVKEFSRNMDMDFNAIGIVVTKFKEDSDVHKTTFETLKKEIYAPVFKAFFKQNNQMASAANYSTKYSTFKQKWGHEESYEAFYYFAKEILEKFEKRKRKAKDDS